MSSAMTGIYSTFEKGIVSISEEYFNLFIQTKSYEKKYGIP
jgi:hypothetical protein